MGWQRQIVLGIPRAERELLGRRIQCSADQFFRQSGDHRVVIDRGALLLQQLQDRSAVDLHADSFEDLDALLMNQVFFLFVQERHACARHLGTSALGPGFAPPPGQSKMHRQGVRQTRS